MRLRGSGRRLVALVAAGVAGCMPFVVSPPALHIPGSELQERVHTVCLWPSDSALPLSRAKLDQIDPLVAHELATRGFTVVPAADVQALTTRIMDSEGGFFDPHTGRRDEVRFRRVRERTSTELGAQLHCDATVNATLALVTAPWKNGHAEWDGFEEGMAPGLLGGYGAFGYLPALSIWISVRDVHDRELFFGTGGIQVLQKLSQGFLTEKFEGVAEDTVLGDAAANARAVHTGLTGFSR